MADAQRQRLAPEARKGLLLDAAQATFVEKGFAASGLAEIAEIAGVSKTLLYHYYPDGRPELYRAVVDRLRADLLPALTEAADAPVSPGRRVDRYVDGLLDFFAGHPGAPRLMLLEPWGSGDPTVVAQAVALRTRLTTDVAGILAGANQPAARISAAAAAVVGTLVQLCEEQVPSARNLETVRETAHAFVAGGLRELGLL
jgi:AcrR family transcriptional regulator